MRILQIISHYVPAYRFGGPLQVAHNLGKAMAKAGHKVTVVTTNLADEKSLLDIPIDQPIYVDGIKVYYENVRFFRYWGFSPMLWQRVAKEIQEVDIVFVHAYYQFANWAGSYLARKYKKEYVVFAHGSLHTQGIESKSSWAKRLYLKFLEKKNFEQSCFIAFNAPEELNKSLYHEHGQVVYSGINPENFKNIPPANYFRSHYPALGNKRFLLFLGRLDIKQKGLDLLLPAYAKLLEQENDIHLVLAGPDEDGAQAKLERLAQDLGIRGDITFTGLISGNPKLAALNEADFYVMPSRYEGLSIALLEALYFGIPMLVTDQVGLSQEIANNNAGIVVRFDQESINQGLIKLIEPSRASSMRGRGTKMILEKYTWDVIAKNLIDKIQAFISKPI